LSDARSRFEAGDLAGAASLLSDSSASADPARLDLIDQIRAAASRAAAGARGRAEDAGARGHPAYLSGDRKEKEAAALPQPAEIGRVVAIYKDAETDYANAASAAAESNLLVRSAVDAYRRGDIPRALADAGRALARHPGAKPAIDLLAEIRRGAQKEAMSARSSALKQGADSSAAFKEAERTREAAEKDDDPRQASQQVAAFQSARDLYFTAAREVTARMTQAQQAVNSGRAALERGDLNAAERSLNEAIAAHPNPDGAAALRTAIEAARRKAAPEAKPEAKPAPPPTPPVKPPPSPVPTGEPASPAARLAVDRAAIVATLQAYADAWGTLNSDEIVKVAPYLAGSPARDLQTSFRQLRSYVLRIADGELAISADGASASVSCTIIREVVSRSSGPLKTVKEPSNVSLEKRDGHWVIVNVQRVGSR
jgi:hypothetical protein